MGVQYVAEYDDGARVVVYSSTQRDEAAIYRECASLLRSRPEAHRVEAWRGGIGPVGSGQYVTRATRGVEVAPPPAEVPHGPAGFEPLWPYLSRETCDAVLDGLRANETAAEHGPECFGVCCLPTPRGEDETKGEAT